MKEERQLKSQSLVKSVKLNWDQNKLPGGQQKSRKIDAVFPSYILNQRPHPQVSECFWICNFLSGIKFCFKNLFASTSNWKVSEFILATRTPHEISNAEHAHMRISCIYFLKTTKSRQNLFLSFVCSNLCFELKTFALLHNRIKIFPDSTFHTYSNCFRYKHFHSWGRIQKFSYSLQEIVGYVWIAGLSVLSATKKVANTI